MKCAYVRLHYEKRFHLVGWPYPMYAVIKAPGVWRETFLLLLFEGEEQCMWVCVNCGTYHIHDICPQKAVHSMRQKLTSIFSCLLYAAEFPILHAPVLKLCYSVIAYWKHALRCCKCIDGWQLARLHCCSSYVATAHTVRLVQGRGAELCSCIPDFLSKCLHSRLFALHEYGFAFDDA